MNERKKLNARLESQHIALSAEVALRKSEEKFKAIFSHGSLGIARIALDGQWLEVNQKLCEILGYSEAELKVLRFPDVTYPADLAEDTRLISELLARKRASYTLEKRYIRKDSKVIWGRLSISLIEASDENPSYIVAFVEDISDQVTLRERLQLSDNIVSVSTDMLAIIDEEGVYRAANRAYANAFQRPIDYFPGKKAVDVIGRDLLKRITIARRKPLFAIDPHNYSAWFELPDKERCYLNISYAPISNIGSTYRGIAVSARDMTSLKLAEMEMQELNQKLERYSYIDGLTKITNRRMLDKSLKNEWNRALRAQSSLAFIMIDIDFFKAYNDHYGHQRGDECLKRIAKVLNKVANRGSDTVARFGGEEFAILIPHADMVQASALAEKCRKAIEAERIPRIPSDGAHNPWVTVSIGVSSCVPSKYNSAKQLVKEADTQLYRAKSSGRNCVVNPSV